MANPVIDLLLENIQDIANESIDLEEFQESLEEFIENFEYAVEESDDRYKHDHLSAGQKATLGVAGAAGAAALAIFAKKHFDKKLMTELEEFPGLKSEIDTLKKDLLSGGIRKGTTLRQIKSIRSKLDKAEASGLLHKTTIHRTRKLLDKLETHARSQKTTWFKNPIHSLTDKYGPRTDRLA